MQKSFEEQYFVSGDNDASFKIFIHEHSSPLHWHKYLEILYILEGKVRVGIGGRETVVNPGTLIFINAKEEHFTDFINHEKHKILCIQFEPDFLYTIKGIDHEIKYISSLLNHKVRYPVYMDACRERELLEILNELLREVEEKKNGYELVVKADFYKLIVWYYRVAEKFWKEEQDERIKYLGNDENRLKMVFQYVNENYMYFITTADVADYVFLSYPYFCKMFKKHMKITFMEYLNKVRMAQAKKLLVYTDFNISDIAAKTGYRDQNYFSRLFKGMFGITPSEYRKKEAERGGEDGT